MLLLLKCIIYCFCKCRSPKIKRVLQIRFTWFISQLLSVLPLIYLSRLVLGCHSYRLINRFYEFIQPKLRIKSRQNKNEANKPGNSRSMGLINKVKPDFLLTLHSQTKGRARHKGLQWWIHLVTWHFLSSTSAVSVPSHQ